MYIQAQNVTPLRSSGKVSYKSHSKEQNHCGQIIGAMVNVHALNENVALTWSIEFSCQVLYLLVEVMFW